ncbi:MAG TPA: sulfate reduction electron transfer complex DsrMKJOP subunit DsrJ [Thermodesulfovibrionales bacterium]|nr:sulfate reduction electron transfer complex DsrMKJOP subunit DsrJ [Thermodesulfovibrionales bacterium]
MKIYDGGKIILGMIVFVGIFTFPFVYNIGKANVRPDPKIDTPAINELKEKKCVESKEFMRAEHMKMLNDWRDSAVRDGARRYVNSEGKEFTISLQNTCMHCHSNKKQFCDQCHNYMAVTPYCWTCHIAPKEKES